MNGSAEHLKQVDMFAPGGGDRQHLSSAQAGLERRAASLGWRKVSPASSEPDLAEYVGAPLQACTIAALILFQKRHIQNTS